MSAPAGQELDDVSDGQPFLEAGRLESVFDPVPQRLFQQEFRTMGWGDFDQDGDPDVALHHFEDGRQFLTMYRNDGETNFTAHEVFQLPEGELHRILLEDLDGDGYPDLMLARSEGPNSIHWNDGAGRFESRGVMLGRLADASYTIIGGDIDADGDNDLVASNNGRTRRYLNDGRGTFSSGRSINREEHGGTDIVAGDIDGDGKGNLIAADGKLFISTMKGELVVVRISPKSYQEIGRAKVIGTTRQAPALANGLLYLRDDREIVCLDVRG